MNTTLKPVLFENIVVGERFLDTVIAIDDHYVKAHAFALDDYDPWHFTGEGSPFERRIAPSTALLNDLMRLLNTLYDPHYDRGLHQREEFWLSSPAFVGESVRLSGGITGTYTRRGRNYFVAEAEARSEADGRLILRHTSIETADVGDPARLGAATTESNAGPSRRIAGIYPMDREPVRAVTADTVVGTPLVVIPKLIHQSQMAVYSNIESYWHTPHTDLRVALEEGLPSTIAQGMMEASWAAELGLAAFGRAWFQTGHGDLAFVGPIYPGTEMRIMGVVSAVRQLETGTWVELDVWIEDATTGSRLAVGWLDAVLGAS